MNKRHDLPLMSFKKLTLDFVFNSFVLLNTLFDFLISFLMNLY